MTKLEELKAAYKLEELKAAYEDAWDAADAARDACVAAWDAACCVAADRDVACYAAYDAYQAELNKEKQKEKSDDT